MKVAVIGGGSTYSPELVDGFGRVGERLGVGELVLQDTDEKRLEVVGGAAQRIARAHGFKGKLILTSDLDAAVDGASAVLLQIRVGGQAARLTDETIPLRCGCVGQETTGAGGFAKALRTVPVVLDIADRVRQIGADRRVDRRLHQPGGHRDARAARPRPSSGRPLQCGHRVPAPVRRVAAT